MSEGDRNGTATLEQPESPFLGYTATAAQGDHGTAPVTLVESPFLMEYQLGDEVVDRESSGIRELLQELYDTEFDETLDELLEEAEGELDRLGLDETPAGAARAERLLDQWVEPLRLEAEAMFDRMAEALDGQELITLAEDELEGVLDRFEPRDTGLSPVMEDFLGKLWKKAKKAVSGAVKLVKKGVAAATKLLPIGVLLRPLKKLVAPLLKRVIRFAINKLPTALQPYASQLAKRFLGELDELDETSESIPASADVRSLQLAFDAEVAALFLAPTPEVRDEIVTEASGAIGEDEATTEAEFDAARQRFIERLEQLHEDEDPTPLVEAFLPAILPALRIGIRIVGRPRVVRFIAGYVGRLISKYVGPKIAPALSQAIVDAGLRLMTLEAPSEAPSRISAEAFANVVEDTVRRIGNLSEEELEDESALEEAAYEGFQEAVAANFPAGLLDPASEYLETSRPAGVWVAMPRGRRPRYRKYSRVYRVTITPQVAKAVKTFSGRTLYDYVRDQLGRTGVVQGRLHLYQAVPGSRAGRILRAERVLGVGTRRPSRRSKRLHPLTRETAGLLLAEPGLGSEVAEAYLDRPEPFAVGERLFFLEVPGAAAAPRRSSDASLAIDLKANELRMAIYLSESDAQAIAVRLRRKEPLGASLVAIRRVYRAAIRAAVGPGHRRIRVVRENPEQEEFVGRMLNIGPHPTRLLARAMGRWIGGAVRRELDRQRDAFIAATSGDADGVTLTVTVKDPPGLRSIAPLLRGGLPKASDLASLGSLGGLLRGAPQSTVTITPGHAGA